MNEKGNVTVRKLIIKKKKKKHAHAKDRILLGGEVQMKKEG